MELLGRGRDCDVFDRGDGTVLRRSRSGHDQTGEARILRHVAEQGYPVPAVHDLAGGGRDLILAKVTGPTMVQALERRPWRARAMGRLLGELHDGLHGLTGPDWLPALPDGGTLVHFDLHPLNVILSPAGPVVIDWTNAVRGRPGHDTARAWVLMATAGAEVSGLLRLALSRVRAGLVRGFLGVVGADEARAEMAYVVDLTLLDPHITEDEKARMRALVEAEASG